AATKSLDSQPSVANRKSPVLGQLAERHVLAEPRLLRQPAPALADDVALPLIGAAVDGRPLCEQRHLGDPAEERHAGRLVERLAGAGIVAMQRAVGAGDLEPEV